MVSGAAIKKLYISKNGWGISTHIDLYDCEPSTVKDKELIKLSVKELGKIIEANLYGETILAYFGATPDVYGYSMLQLIDSSNMAAHYVEKTNHVFFEMFSCKPYDPEKVVDYLMKIHKAKGAKAKVLFRGLPDFHEHIFVKGIIPNN